MDDAVDIRVCLEDSIEILLFPDVDVIEFGCLARDELDTIDCLFRRVLEVIHNDDFVARFEEGKGGERANVTRAAVSQVSTLFVNGRAGDVTL